MDHLIAMIEELAESGRLAKAMAKLMKQMYDELVNEGFTPDQAIAIVSAFNLTGG